MEIRSFPDATSKITEKFKLTPRSDLLSKKSAKTEIGDVTRPERRPGRGCLSVHAQYLA